MHVVNMIEKIHFEWLLLKKKKTIFVNELNITFDISRADTLVKMKNQIGRNFLYDQRQN